MDLIRDGDSNLLSMMVISSTRGRRGMSSNHWASINKVAVLF